MLDLGRPLLGNAAAATANGIASIDLGVIVLDGCKGKPCGGGVVDLGRPHLDNVAAASPDVVASVDGVLLATFLAPSSLTISRT